MQISSAGFVNDYMELFHRYCDLHREAARNIAAAREYRGLCCVSWLYTDEIETLKRDFRNNRRTARAVRRNMGRLVEQIAKAADAETVHTMHETLLGFEKMRRSECETRDAG